MLLGRVTAQKSLVQTCDSVWPFSGNSVISLCFGAQFIDDGYELILPPERYFIDSLFTLSFPRAAVVPTHRFQENHLEQDDLDRFVRLLRDCPIGSRILFHGWFQKKSAFRVPLYSLIQRFFRIRPYWLYETTRVLKAHGVDLDRDLIVNIRGREYKQVWGGVNYVGVDWAQKAIQAFGASVRKVFLVSDDDDIPAVSDGTPLTHLSRDHNQFVDFCLLANARHAAIPKSSFSFVAVLAAPHRKRVLYPGRWLVTTDYAHQMVEMLDEVPFIEKVRLPGY